MTNPAPIVDEYVYVAVDKVHPAAAALVSGLTITRRPDRFTPVVCLTNLGTHAPDTEP